jgi:hypothetical protein
MTGITLSVPARADGSQDKCKSSGCWCYIGAAVAQGPKLPACRLVLSAADIGHRHVIRNDMLVLSLESIGLSEKRCCRRRK